MTKFSQINPQELSFIIGIADAGEYRNTLNGQDLKDLLICYSSIQDLIKTINMGHLISIKGKNQEDIAEIRDFFNKAEYPLARNIIYKDTSHNIRRLNPTQVKKILDTMEKNPCVELETKTGTKIPVNVFDFAGAGKIFLLGHFTLQTLLEEDKNFLKDLVIY